MTADLIPLRIGDVERDEVVSSLGDHFAAGRLTKDEYDERVDQALTARFSHDIEPLLADLPKPAPVAPAVAVRESSRPRLGMPILVLALPLMFALVMMLAIALHAPWMLFGLFWFVMIGGFGRHHGHRRHR